MTPRSQPLHVGILCDYGSTPRPDEGVGVFIYNLIDGLLALESPPQITLRVHPGEEHRMQALWRRWGNAIAIHPPPGPPLACRWLESIYAVRDALRVSLLANAMQGLQSWLRPLLQVCRSPGATRSKKLAALVALGLLGLVLGPCLWVVAIVYHVLIGGVLATLAYPVELVLHGGQRWRATLDGPPVELSMEEQDKVGVPDCDVWLVPHGRTDMQLNAPEVLVIWDVVHHHVAGIFGPELYEMTERTFHRRARRAALLGCASQSVRNGDLVRLFPFAEDRLRVVPLAPPKDLIDAPRRNLGWLRWKHGIGTDYLFCPAALRPHKNQITLVRALAWLSREHGLTLELVCTGKGAVSPQLERVIKEEGLERHVHFLGVVSRIQIANLYRNALLAVVPSLHEGYGLPILEALQTGCLLTCSDIPAFRELLAGCEDAVLFFDPRDHRALGDAVRRTLDEGERLRQAQQEVHQLIGRRDWIDVAQDYFDLFQEARKLGPPAPGFPSSSHQQREAAAHA